MKERPVKEHRVDDDPDGASVAGIAAGELRSGQALSSTGVSRRRRLIPTENARRPRSKGEAAEQQESAKEAIQVEVAHEADACGALGCRRDELLLEIVVDGETRVLCRDHARRWANDE